MKPPRSLVRPPPRPGKGYQLGVRLRTDKDHLSLFHGHFHHILVLVCIINVQFKFRQARQCYIRATSVAIAHLLYWTCNNCAISYDRNELIRLVSQFKTSLKIKEFILKSKQARHPSQLVSKPTWAWSYEAIITAIKQFMAYLTK